MNHERDVRAWLAYAQADRRSARNAMKAADYRDVAFHCQQVAEKSLKAIIVRQTRRRPRSGVVPYGTTPPHSHNLWRLWQHISDVTCPPDVREALAALSQHYTLSRYPGVDVKYDLATAREMMERMERVWQWFTQTLNLVAK